MFIENPKTSDHIGRKWKFSPKEIILRIGSNVQENEVALIAFMPNSNGPNPNTNSSWFEKPTFKLWPTLEFRSKVQ